MLFSSNLQSFNMFACFPLLLPLFTQSCSFSLAVKTPRWNSTFCLCTKTLDVEEKKREKSDKHWAHVHNIWRGKGKREKTLRTNCCFSEKAETLLFFSCCRFIIIFRFSSPFSRINISIIEPSWFWCCHVTAFVVLRAKIADNFLRDEIILRLVTNRNIFFQFFATLVLLLAENGKKSSPSCKYLLRFELPCFAGSVREFSIKTDQTKESSMGTRRFGMRFLSPCYIKVKNWGHLREREILSRFMLQEAE